MKKPLALAAAIGSTLLSATALAAPATQKTLAVYGDWPYSQAILARAPQLISSINNDPDVSLVLHVGDIHSGSMPCNASWNQGILGLFEQLQDPVVYTPGDNEWSDCHKAKELSSGYPLSELASIRSLFFSRPGYTLGVDEIQVQSQALTPNAQHPADQLFVENVMWKDAGVMFVTLDVPGSNDDTMPWTGTFSNPSAQAQEVADRDAANLRWLEDAFWAARSDETKALVIGLQADMWDPSALAPGGDGLSAYTKLVQKLAGLCLWFHRPVLLINGDSHVFNVDQPLADPNSASGQIHHAAAVPNLTRMTVEGSTAADEWVKLKIDTSSPGVFSWQRIVY